MTQAEAAAALIEGSLNTNSTYVTVRRDQLLLALGATTPNDEQPDSPPADIVS